MKKLFIWTLWIATGFVSPVYPEISTEKSIALCLIWDAASSNRPVWQDIHALARQSISSLKTGDYLEMISADQWDTHIRISQSPIQATPQEIQDFCRQLQNIDCPLIADTDVIKALELGVDRMRKFVLSHHDIQPVFIVLSDGQLRDLEASKCTPLTETLDTLGWKLYFTGSKDTNRKILLEAGQNKIRWSLLQKADCGSWIATARTHEIVPQPVKEPPKTETVAVGPVPTQPEPIIILQPIIQSEPAKQDLEITPPKSIVSDSNEPSALFSMPITSEPNRAAASDVNSLGPSAKSGVLKGLWIPLIGLMCVTAIGLFFFMAVKTSNQWRERIQKHLRALKIADTGTLIIRHQDRTWHLGQLRRLNKIYIGSGPKNTLRLFDKDIAVKHALLYVKRGTLWLKNLSPRPVWINRIPLKSGHKDRVSLPSILKLSDNAVMKCELQKYPLTPIQEKEVAHV